MCVQYAVYKACMCSTHMCVCVCMCQQGYPPYGFFSQNARVGSFRPRNYVFGAGKSCTVGHFLDRFYPTGAHFRAASWENRDFGVFGRFGRALRHGKSIFLQTF